MTNPTPVQREQQWLRERVGAPKEPRLGCSLVAHDRLGFCAGCASGGEGEAARAENLGWQMLALRQDEVAQKQSADNAQRCHNGHPFEPGQDADALDEPGDPRWCDTCGEARRLAAPLSDDPAHTDGAS